MSTKLADRTPQVAREHDAGLLGSAPAMAAARPVASSVLLVPGTSTRSALHDFARVEVLARRDAEPVAGRAPWRFAAAEHPRLAAGTPAWSENGEIFLTAQAVLSPPALRTEMLRHEVIHSLHQGAAPRDESASARARAERLATDSTTSTKLGLLSPVPSLLGFPPQPHKPFDRVWIGHSGIIGEIVHSGITVRAFVPYERIGIDALGQPDKAFHCGKHDRPPIPDLVTKMVDAARVAAKLNKGLPAAARPYAAQLVGVVDDSSAYRTAKGTPVIILKEAELMSGAYPDTLAHETAHGLYEFHSVARNTKARTPDAYALRIADIFNRAKDTTKVPQPVAKFDPTKPPLLTPGGVVAAGVAMVTDTLLTGEGGHPWSGPDEFFASAYAGFLRHPALQKQIFEHYAKADPEVGPIAKELLQLLRITTQPKALGRLTTPKREREAARTLERVGAPQDIGDYDNRVGWLVNPGKMPGPAEILCGPAKPGPAKPTESELPDFGDDAFEREFGPRTPEP